MEKLGDTLVNHFDGIAAYCNHPVRFGVVELLNTTIKGVLRRARGIGDEAVLLLKLKWASATPIRSSRDSHNSFSRFEAFRDAHRAVKIAISKRAPSTARQPRPPGQMRHTPPHRGLTTLLKCPVQNPDAHSHARWRSVWRGFKSSRVTDAARSGLL